jgi:uncharacterized membrane protein
MYVTGTSFYVGTTKIIVLVFFMVGAIGTAVPWNTPNYASILHFIGAAFFVGGFGIYNFICQLLRYIRKHTPKPTKKKFDFYLDKTFVILVFLVTVWYLVSGLLGLLEQSILFPEFEKVGYVALIFQTALSQKMVLFISGIAAFLLDPEDI